MTDQDLGLVAERRFAGAVILRGYKDLVGTSVSADDRMGALSWFLAEGSERGSFDAWCRLLDLDPGLYRNHLRNMGLLPGERVARNDHRLRRWLRGFLRRDLKRRAKHCTEVRGPATPAAYAEPFGSNETSAT